MEDIIRKVKQAQIEFEAKTKIVDEMLDNSQTDIMRNYLTGKKQAYSEALIELGTILRMAQQAA